MGSRTARGVMARITEGVGAWTPGMRGVMEWATGKSPSSYSGRSFNDRRSVEGVAGERPKLRIDEPHMADQVSELGKIWPSKSEPISEGNPRRPSRRTSGRNAETRDNSRKHKNKRRAHERAHACMHMHAHAQTETCRAQRIAFGRRSSAHACATQQSDGSAGPFAVAKRSALGAGRTAPAALPSPTRRYRRGAGEARLCRARHDVHASRPGALTAAASPSLR